MFVGAVAFSNLTRNYGLPAYFVGILIDSEKLESLESLPTKEFFQPSRDKLVEPFDLSAVTKAVNEYSGSAVKIVWKEVQGLPDKPKQLAKEEYISTSQAIIDQLEQTDLMIIASGISEIRVHNPFEGESQPEAIDLTGFMKLGDDKTITEKRGNFSRITELARLMAWHQYLTSRRNVPTFVRSYLKLQHQPKMKHLIQIGWPRIGLGEYANSFIGFPEAMVKNGAAPTSHVLSPGSFVSLFPIAKCCVGPIDSLNSPDGCVKKGGTTYGEVLPIDGSDIRCSTCRSSVDRLKLGLKAARKASKDKSSPVGKYSEDFYYVYVSLFGTRLKVGRARLSRGISRIMEQGAADALVFYPLTSFEQADEFESEVLKQLKSRKADLDAFEVTEISDRAYVADKIELIRQYYTGGGIGNRADFYKEVSRVITLSEMLAPRTQLLQNRVLSFLDNWWLPNDSKFLNLTQLPEYWQRIEGSLEGSVGSLLVVGGQLIDLEKLQGSIFRGDGFEPERS
jgi:hypothetical protein